MCSLFYPVGSKLYCWLFSFLLSAFGFSLNEISFESFRERKINVFSNPHGSDGTR
jgi:hypothetical protein